MDTDFREMVANAYDQVEADGASAASGDEGSEAVASAPPPEPAHEPVPAGAPELAGDSAPDTKTTDARARDATGRFAPRAKDTAKVAAPTPGGVSTTAPAASTGASPTAADVAPPPTTPELRAPQSWKPEAREKWAALPPEVQREAHRLEADTKRALQEAAPARRFAQEAHQAMAPLAPLLQSRGISPTQAIASYVQADQMLSHPDQSVKANALAQLFHTYGVDLATFAKALDAAPQQAPQQQHQQVDPRAIAAQVRQEIQQDMQQQRRQRETTQAHSLVQEFASNPAHEFFEDVAPVMAALIDASGGKLPLKEAYEQAVWSKPELRAIAQKRQEAEAAKARTASTAQARNAASSVKSTPTTAANAGVVRGKGGNYREDVAAAYDSLFGK